MKTIRTVGVCLPILFCLVLFSWRFTAWVMPLASSAPSPFALVVNEVNFVPVTPYEVAEGYDTKVQVVLDHTGPAPAWWGSSFDGLGVGTYGDEPLYYQTGTNRKQVIAPSPYTAPYVWSPVWDEPRQHYVAYYLVDLAHVPAHPGQVMLRGHLAVGMMPAGMMPFQKNLLSPAVLVSIPVRQPGQIVRVPAVSHDPMLTIEDVQMTKYAPADAQSNSGMDTRVTMTLRYHGPMPLINPGCPTGYPKLTDDRNQEISPRSISWHGLQDLADGSNGKIPKGQQFQIEYNIQSMPAFTKAQTLTLTDFASAYNHWPLSYQIVLHDAKNSPWTKPGKKPWSSHPRVLLTNSEHPYI